MPVTATLTLGTGAAIKSEASGTRSREPITLITGQGLVLANTVLGKITASGKYTRYDNDASDGSQTAAAILLADTDTTAGDAKGVGFVRDCEVWTSRLVWGAGITTEGEKTAAYADMAAAGIVLR